MRWIAVIVCLLCIAPLVNAQACIDETVVFTSLERRYPDIDIVKRYTGMAAEKFVAKFNEVSVDSWKADVIVVFSNGDEPNYLQVYFVEGCAVSHGFITRDLYSQLDTATKQVSL